MLYHQFLWYIARHPWNPINHINIFLFSITVLQTNIDIFIYKYHNRKCSLMHEWYIHERFCQFALKTTEFKKTSNVTTAKALNKSKDLENRHPPSPHLVTFLSPTTFERLTSGAWGWGCIKTSLPCNAPPMLQTNVLMYWCRLLKLYTIQIQIVYSAA